MVKNFKTVAGKLAPKFAALFFLPAIFFVIAAWFSGIRATNIFQLPMLVMRMPLPVIIVGLIFVGLASFQPLLPEKIRKNTPGILLAAFFFAGHLALGSIFNTAENYTNNVFFAADSGSWQGRLASDNLWEFGLRAVHPFAFIILRPIVAIVSLTTGGDHFFASLIVLALAGAACVYVTWKLLVENQFDGYYAVGFASLLGLSASHLLFGSIFESYIFSALFLILFALHTLNKNKPIWALIVAGVLTFGMTISNLAQEVIVFSFARKDVRVVNVFFLFTGVLAAATIVNFANNQIYNSNIYFFSSENVAAESKNIQLPTVDHAVLLAQNMFIFNITAPQPHFRGQAARLRFNFASDGFYYYTLAGTIALIGWILLLCVSTFKFFQTFDLSNQSTRFSLAMLACLGFNYFLHILYGVEPFLYTGDWTYALILFVAFNVNGFAQKIWFKISFLVFLGFILINNGWFIYFIISILKKNVGAAF